MESVLEAGLRAEFEQIALETRGELRLAALDRLDPGRLAEHYAIETLSIDVFRDSHPEAVKQLMDVEPSAFSAATVFFGSRRTIVFNPQHSPRRHVNTIAHELAHVLLEHEPSPLFDATWKRHWVPSNEDEADYLAGALLVPRTAVGPIMESVASDLVEAAEHFGVSEKLMEARVEAAADAKPAAEAELAALLNGGEGMAGVGQPLIRINRRSRGGGDEPAPVAPSAAF